MSSVNQSITNIRKRNMADFLRANAHLGVDEKNVDVVADAILAKGLVAVRDEEAKLMIVDENSNSPRSVSEIAEIISKIIATPKVDVLCEYLSRCWCVKMNLHHLTVNEVAEKLRQMGVSVVKREDPDDSMTESDARACYSLRVPYPYPTGGAGNYIIPNRDAVSFITKAFRELTASRRKSEVQDQCVDDTTATGDINIVTVRWFDAYLEEFRATEARFGSDLLFLRLEDGNNRHIPLRQVRWWSMTKESHQNDRG